VSQATLIRLPKYYRYLKEKLKEGIENISSTVISLDLKLSSIQIRKDLALVSDIAGKPKTGFNTKELIISLEKFLGYDNTNQAVLVGVGKLGEALLSYDGFNNYGLNIVMAFDKNEKLYDKNINGKYILPLEKMENLIKRLNIHMGIITVPVESAQEICDAMVKSGIKAIWNFAPTHLNVPENIVIKSEDMAESLAILSNKLNKIMKN